MGALGTCFVLDRPDRFVTAAHCVQHIQLADLEVQALELGSKRSPVTHVRVHPTADLAVLTIELPDEHLIEAMEVGTHEAFFGGTNVVAFGFPSDSTYLGKPDSFIRIDGPTLRFFKGHIQRNGLHISASGYKYQSLELSFAAPSGLSGSPVFVEGQDHPIAMVAENFESSTYLRTITEVIDGRSEFRETIHSVVSYGVAVDLRYIRAWLHEQ